MYQQMQDGGVHPLLHHPASPPASSSSSSSRQSCPCCPSLTVPSLFSSRFSLSFFLSSSFLWLSLILSLTATSVADFIRMSFGGPVIVWIGAWKICQQVGQVMDCSTLSIQELDVLGDSVAFDGFRAFLLLTLLFAFTAALLSTVRLVVQLQGKRPIPRWADVFVVVLITCTAVSQILSFSLFLDAYRTFKSAYGGPIWSTKSYGASFVCLISAFAIQCLAVILHSITWHFYTKKGAASPPQSVPMQAMPPPAQAAPQAFNLPAPSSYAGSPYYTPPPFNYAPNPVQYGGGGSFVLGAGPAGPSPYMQAPSPFPSSYMQSGYSHYTPAAAVLSPQSSVPAPSVVHYGQVRGPS